MERAERGEGGMIRLSPESRDPPPFAPCYPEEGNGQQEEDTACQEAPLGRARKKSIVAICELRRASAGSSIKSRRPNQREIPLSRRIGTIPSVANRLRNYRNELRWRSIVQTAIPQRKQASDNEST